MFLSALFVFAVSGEGSKVGSDHVVSSVQFHFPSRLMDVTKGTC
jgi:hypothetical protein